MVQHQVHQSLVTVAGTPGECPQPLPLRALSHVCGNATGKVVRTRTTGLGVTPREQSVKSSRTTAVNRTLDWPTKWAVWRAISKLIKSSARAPGLFPVQHQVHRSLVTVAGTPGECPQ